MSISIPWGKDEELEFELPKGWRLGGVIEPSESPPIIDIEEELAKTIATPIGSPPLSELCRNKRRLVIVVDDISRPTPIYLFMEKLLAVVLEAGVSEEAITLIPALGTHRAMTTEEMEKKVGASILKRVRWVNHDYRDKTQLVRIGRTNRGTPVEINRIVSQADLVILVGTIEPHSHAGFGGGYKNLLPGVAGARTIGRNHLLSATRINYSMVGWRPEDNPMRLDIEEAGRLLNAPCFLVNTILTPELEVAKIVAGDPVGAHGEGVGFSQRLYGVPLESRADVVISGSYPMDHDLRQGVKAVANTFMAAREGGLVIAAIRCQNGMGDIDIPKIRIPLRQTLLRAASRSLLPFIKYTPVGIPVEERFYMYTALRTILRNRIKIFAPKIPEEVRRNFSLFFSLGSLQDTLEEATTQYPKAGVLVFPKGGVTYPIIPG